MSTDSEFQYDVFLSHSKADKDVVRDIANRLKSDGVKVWFDEWEIRPGDSIPAKIEDGLEHSRVLVLCMSKAAFGSDWAELESHTFRFKDPLNHNRRFIPLRLDDTPIKGSLAQFSYIDWTGNASVSHAKLARSIIDHDALKTAYRPGTAINFRREFGAPLVTACDFSRNGRAMLTGHVDGTLCVWDIQSRTCHQKVAATTEKIDRLRWSDDEERVFVMPVSGKPVLYDLTHQEPLVTYTKALVSTRQMDCFRLLAGGARVDDVAWAMGLHEMTVRQHLDALRKKLGLRTRNEVRGVGLDVYGDSPSASYPPIRSSLAWVPYIAWMRELEYAMLWKGKTESRFRFCQNFSGEWHDDHLPKPNPWILDWNQDRSKTVYADRNVLFVCDPFSARCIHILEGHTSHITHVVCRGEFVASGAIDGAVRLWDLRTGRFLGDAQVGNGIGGIGWCDRYTLLIGTLDGGVFQLDRSSFVAQSGKNLQSSRGSEQVQYTNAKVLLVGNSAAGKTGLSNRLALDTYKETDSTVGAWATQWKLPLDDVGLVATGRDDDLTEDDSGDRPVGTGPTVEREVWLWDFGGQADQRLIHQLYMDQTQVAALVFDPQKDDVFETLGQWDRDLSRANKDKSDRDKMTKLLVAGRCDAGGLRVAQSQVEDFAKERGYDAFVETSAKTSNGCEELKQAIINGIKWENIPWRSSPVLFKRLKDEIIQLKDEDRVLLRFNELREVLSLRMQAEDTKFTDAELKAVVGLLAGPGVVWELEFGSWVLLQPERINAYAQAVIQTVREDEHDRGCILEERVLNGDLTYHASIPRLPPDEERFVLLAMHQILVERGLCIRQLIQSIEGTDGRIQSDKPLLIFPSYYRRERPELVGAPAIVVSYQFNGFLDEIYATLVVKLHHTTEFDHDELWRYAADFKSKNGHSLGVRLTRRAEGEGELDVYFGSDVPVGERIIFSKYVHEHLLQSANDVVRLRHYVCPHCGTPVGNRQVAMRKLEEGKKDIPCVECDDPNKRVPLWDELEELFADDQIKQRVRELNEHVRIVLDTESKERALVGEVISTVALAGQICREVQVSDWGIDAEVEFKNDDGEATAKRVWLQLKSGDSFLKIRKKDGAAIFKGFNQRQAKYWMDHAEPVLLLIRNSKGEIQWIDIREKLRNVTNDGEKQVRQIEFTGKRFDVMSVRGWRDAALAGTK